MEIHDQRPENQFEIFSIETFLVRGPITPITSTGPNDKAAPKPLALGDDAL